MFARRRASGRNAVGRWSLSSAGTSGPVTHGISRSVSSQTAAIFGSAASARGSGLVIGFCASRDTVGSPTCLRSARGPADSQATATPASTAAANSNSTYRLKDSGSSPAAARCTGTRPVRHRKRHDGIQAGAGCCYLGGRPSAESLRMITHSVGIAATTPFLGRVRDRPAGYRLRLVRGRVWSSPDRSGIACNRRLRHPFGCEDTSTPKIVADASGPPSTTNSRAGGIGSTVAGQVGNGLDATGSAARPSAVWKSSGDPVSHRRLGHLG